MAKRSREEKDKEFIDSIEMVMGFPLMEHQKPKLLYIRKQTVTGMPVDVDVLKGRKTDGSQPASSQQG